MASQTPTTTTRRVLSDLNVNAPVPRSPSKYLRSPSASPRKPTKVVETTSIKESVPLSSPTRFRCQNTCEESGMGSNKRPASAMSGATDESCKSWEISRTHTSVRMEAEVRDDAETRGDDVLERECKRAKSGSPMAVEMQNTLLSSQTTSSPASLFESSGIGLDEGEDSQNTITTSITEPDESPRGVAHIPHLSHINSRTRTPEQIRQDARAIKLRLSLASYKLRTNQLDVPLERLQVKTMSSNLPPLPRVPRLPGTAGISRKRIPLPSAPSTIPSINVPRQPSIKRESYRSVSSSPPRRLQSLQESAATTPILPRQREALLNPPSLDSPIWTQTPEKRSPDGRDLTSSVVKGRAADGLLSLMGARK